jgi:DnaJ-class molecular chaperone
VALSEEAEARFRELAEAYTVLSKSESRLLYDRYGYRGRGNQGLDEALWEGREQIERGENVHLSLELKSFEADQGTRRLITYEANVRCDNCQGRGVTGEADPECRVCDGTGAVASERKLRLIIPAGLVNGSQLRVNGDGNYGGWGSVPGDLLVDVTVIPAPRDPRLVRYLALALLLIALATLAIYVVTH